MPDCEREKLNLQQNLKSEPHQVLEETNKAGLNALLLAVHTDQAEVAITIFVICKTFLILILPGSDTGYITQVVCLLLECGANPDSRDKDGESAVHAAVREESSHMLQILLKVPNIRPSYILILLQGWCQPQPTLTPGKVPPAPGSRAKPALPRPSDGRPGR